MKPSAEDQSIQEDTEVLTAGSCRFAAYLFNYGNIITVLVPPLGLLWMAASMVIYAMNRHHPNEKVGHYTQQAAYRIYGVIGFIVAAAIFIPKNGLYYYLGLWVMAIVIILPLSIRDLIKIRKDDWCDVEIENTVSDND